VSASVYEVTYSTNGTDWTEIDGIQEISATIGKTSFVDTISPSRMTFVAWYPTGFYSPNTALVTGTQVRLARVGSTYRMWAGRIADVQVEYGIPYDSDTNTGVSDHVTVTCEGALADWGRLQGGGTQIDEGDAYYALAQIVSVSGLSLGTTFTPGDSPLVAASTVDNSYADWLNVFAQTTNAIVKDGSGEVGVLSPDVAGTLLARFSDQTNNSTHQAYEQITFTSEVENYFTQVIIRTNQYGDVAVEKVGASAPYRTLSIDTFSGSAAQAGDLADYYLTSFGEPFLGVKESVARSETQTAWNLDLGYGWWDILGYRTTVDFRGTTRHVAILGSSFHATPTTSTFTYHLADAEFFPYFVLNSDVWGFLDTNKLSF
jgi:hypothetical protein